MELEDLGLLAQRLKETYEYMDISVERELPSEFKSLVTSFTNNDDIIYNKYTVEYESSSGLKIFFPNQWIYIAAFFTDYYFMLQAYKKEAIAVIESRSNSKDLTKVIDQCRRPGGEEYTNSLFDEAGYSGDNRELLVRFLSDYSWWGGGKTIDRVDFFVSPILSLAGLVNASQGYVADLCAFLANHKEALKILKRNFDFDDDDDDDSFSKINITQPLQQIFYGAPGTGKSFTINKITSEERANTIRTTFHPDSDYASFVGAYKPTMVQVPVTTVIGTKAEVVENSDGSPFIESKISYQFVGQAFLKAYVRAWQIYTNAIDFDEVEQQYLVIEEINRGNCAQIFGDLFQLLDRNHAGFSDYPIEADSDMQAYLRWEFRFLGMPLADEINSLYRKTGRDIVREVFDGKILLLPNNLHIWATMNTSDQSLFPIDSAFKRRWDWKYVPIADAGKNWKIEFCKADGEEAHLDWWTFVQQINRIIAEMTSSADKQLGYFFCKADKKSDDTLSEPDIISKEVFVGKVLFYLWNDVFKDYGFDDADLFKYVEKVEGGKDVEREITFPDFYEANGEVNMAVSSQFISNVLAWNKA